MIEWINYWYLFPASIAIATIAMASGIGGAVFFSPLFIILLKLEPSVAIGAALLTELFGFTSGVYAYYKSKLIDYKIGITLLWVSVPAAILGSQVVAYFPGHILKAIFAVGIIIIGWQMYDSYRQEKKEKENAKPDQNVEKHGSKLLDRKGREYRYTFCNRGTARIFAGIGGFFLGMISVGLAELQEYHLLVRCKIPAPVAVATSVFLVVITVLFASIGHIVNFCQSSNQEVLTQVCKIIVFTAPGVLIGGQLGPWVQTKVNPEIMKIVISILFVLIGFFLLWTLTI